MRADLDPAILTTRREFLAAGVAAGALLALEGCGSSPPDEPIVRAAIHPAIGIGRVGNSRESFFFGPEVPGALPHAKSGSSASSGLRTFSATGRFSEVWTAS